MLTEICADIRNYFPVHSHGHENGRDIYAGHYEISGGAITSLDFLCEGQYFRIVGSVFNDGVHKYSSDPSVSLLTDEVFDGCIWAMAVPPSVIALASEIQEYNEKSEVSPFTSESFGGYSYSKATNSKGVSVSWKDAFASKLDIYRRIRL